MREVADALKALPRIFLDLVLPRLPDLDSRLRAGARVLDVGCGGGWAVVQIAERFPGTRCVGIDVEPYSVDQARRLIAERGLADRCEARVGSVDQLGEQEAYDVATSFLVVHEIAPAMKPAAFTAVARALKPGGHFLIFDEVYPETDAALRTMPSRFAALAQWYEVIWGNVVDTRSALHALCRQAGLEVAEETTFSRFHIILAAKTYRVASRSRCRRSKWSPELVPGPRMAYAAAAARPGGHRVGRRRRAPPGRRPGPARRRGRARRPGQARAVPIGRGRSRPGRGPGHQDVRVSGRHPPGDARGRWRLPCLAGRQSDVGAAQLAELLRPDAVGLAAAAGGCPRRARRRTDDPGRARGGGHRPAAGSGIWASPSPTRRARCSSRSRGRAT